MFSATWPTEIQRLASEFLSDPVKITIGSQDLSASHSVSQARRHASFCQNVVFLWCHVMWSLYGACVVCHCCVSVAGQTRSSMLYTSRCCSGMPTSDDTVAAHSRLAVTRGLPLPLDMRPNTLVDTPQTVEVINPRDRDRRLEQLLRKYHSSRRNRVIVFVLYKKVIGRPVTLWCRMSTKFRRPNTTLLLQTNLLVQTLHFWLVRLRQVMGVLSSSVHKQEAARVESQLQRAGWKAAAVHGDASQQQRTRAVEQFKVRAVAP